MPASRREGDGPTPPLRRHGAAWAAVATVVVAALWWLWPRAPEGGTVRAASGGGAHSGGGAGAGRGGIPPRVVDPAGVLRLPGVEGEVVEKARRHQLDGREIRFAIEDDRRAYTDLVEGPKDAIVALAACTLPFVKVSAEFCTTHFRGTFVRDSDGGSLSRLVAIEDVWADREPPEDMDEFDPKTPEQQEACRAYRRCVAQALLGHAFHTPHDMQGVEAWSSRVGPDAVPPGEDFAQYRPGDDVAELLETSLSHYEASNPWLSTSDDYEELMKAGDAACVEELAPFGAAGEGALEVCQSNTGRLVTLYLLRKKMLEALR